MLKNIATLYRALQLYTQAAHNKVSTCAFFADHAFLGEVYEAMESAYDSLVERAIGLGEKLDLLAMNVDAAKAIEDLKLEKPEVIWSQLLENENSLLEHLEEASTKASIGTQNLLAQLADDSEARIYKIKQRIQ